MRHISDMTALTQDTGLRSRLLARIAANPDEVWVPSDFADLGNRPAIDKTLQRLVAAGDLRRIDRGLYDRPRMNDLTGRPTVPGTFAITPTGAMVDALENDYANTTAMIFGAAPAFEEILVSIKEIEWIVNSVDYQGPGRSA